MKTVPKSVKPTTSRLAALRNAAQRVGLMLLHLKQRVTGEDFEEENKWVSQHPRFIEMMKEAHEHPGEGLTTEELRRELGLPDKH